METTRARKPNGTRGRVRIIYLRHDGRRVPTRRRYTRSEAEDVAAGSLVVRRKFIAAILSAA